MQLPLVAIQDTTHFQLVKHLVLNVQLALHAQQQLPVQLLAQVVLTL